MPGYLLDTNILSDLMRHPGGRIGQNIARHGAEQVCTSIVIIAELRFGIAKQPSGRLLLQLTTTLEGLEVLPFEAPADLRYAELRAQLEQRGNTIGANDMLANDMLIAAPCLGAPSDTRHRQ